MAILSNLVIAASGTLLFSSQEIKKWVEANGGRWTPIVQNGRTITHLITDEASWKAGTEAVQMAVRLGAFVVSYDWLEDSLLAKRKLSERKYTMETIRKDKKKRKELKKLGKLADSEKFRNGCVDAKNLTGSGTSNRAPLPRKPKKSSSFFFQKEPLPNKPFDSATEALKTKWAEREAVKEALNMASETQVHNLTEVEEAAESSAVPSSSSVALPPTKASEFPSETTRSSSPLENIAELDTEKQAKNTHIKDLYHYYLDTTGFEYKVNLTRNGLLAHGPARYQIALFETHTKPHAYCTNIQYSPPARKVLESSDNNRGVRSTGLRNPLLSFLRNAENETGQHQGTVSNHSNNTKQAASQYSTQPVPKPSQQDDHEDTNRARLNSLVNSSTPYDEAPYNTLICPMNSSFSDAWRAFRHAFRDVTLLSWEERFDADMALQKPRAKQLGVEPFLFTRPRQGLPGGLSPQEPGLFQGSANGLEIYGEANDGYTRNTFNLPGLSQPLSEHGTIGGELAREEEARKRQEERERMKAEEKVKNEKKNRGEGQPKKKVNYNKPFFNGATGTPVPETQQRDTKTKASSGNIASGDYMGMTKKRQKFPRGWYGDW